MPPAKQQTPFQQTHIVMFGLKIMDRDLNTHIVMSIRCQFCIFHGREEYHLEQVRKRQKTTIIKTWSGSFRSDLYQHHHREQYSSIWKMYQILSHDEKVLFFKNKTSFNATLPRLFDHESSANRPLIFTIDASIVDIIIREMYFRPAEEYNNLNAGQARAMKLFTENIILDNYEITITNQMQFQLYVGQISQGNSFRQIVGNLLSMKAIADVSRIGNLNEAIVDNYARVI